MTDPTTRPIYAPPREPAPDTPTECPRCGATSISRHGVRLHDAEHARQDRLFRRMTSLLDALEEMLTVFDGDPDPETGERKTFRAWVDETDTIIDGHHRALEGLLAKPADADEPRRPVAEVIAWPGETTATGAIDLPGFGRQSTTPEPDAIREHLAARATDDDLAGLVPAYSPPDDADLDDLDDDDPDAVEIPGRRF